MATKTRPRPRAEKKAEAGPARGLVHTRALMCRIRYVESLMAAAMDFDTFEARADMVTFGLLPDVEATAVAYYAAYTSDIEDAEGLCILLDEFVKARRGGYSLGLADFLEDYLNADGGRPRLEVFAPADTAAERLPGKLTGTLTITGLTKAIIEAGTAPAVEAPEPAVTAPEPAVTAPKASRKKKAAADPSDPPRHDPLPGQGELPLDGDDDAPPPDYDDAVLAGMQAEAEADAKVVAAALVASGPKRGAKPWAVGAPISYRAGKHWVHGSVVEDPGDGRLTMALANRPEKAHWVVAKARCRALKLAEAAAEAPEPEPEAVALVLGVPETLAARMAGYLALESIPGLEDDAEAENFLLEFPGGAVLAAVVNGTPALGRRPYVRIWVFDDKDEIAYEHPVADFLVGAHVVAVAGRPARLEIVAEASGAG